MYLTSYFLHTFMIESRILILKYSGTKIILTIPSLADFRKCSNSLSNTNSKSEKFSWWCNFLTLFLQVGSNPNARNCFWVEVFVGAVFKDEFFICSPVCTSSKCSTFVIHCIRMPIYFYLCFFVYTLLILQLCVSRHGLWDRAAFLLSESFRFIVILERIRDENEDRAERIGW